MDMNTNNIVGSVLGERRLEMKDSTNIIHLKDQKYYQDKNRRKLEELVTQENKENTNLVTLSRKDSKRDQRNNSSEPKSTGQTNQCCDKENVPFHAFSPQPQRKGLLPRVQRLRDKGKKTLILDLDETLVHSSFDKCKCDLELPIIMDNQRYIVYVKIRPRAIDFLRKITKYYEVAIFTASVADYADPLIDKLDTNNYGFYKLFREHCTYNGNYTKDLSKLGRDLKDCIIVDNLPKSYVNQPENGIPILSWYDDRNDKELDALFPLLIALSKVGDVRKRIKRFVKKDRIDYESLFSAFEKKPDLHHFVRKILGIKRAPFSPRRHAKSPKDNLDSKRDKENRNITSNDPESSSKKKKAAKKKMIKKNSYESPKKTKRSKNKVITLEENYSQTKTYQKGNLDSIKREGRQRDHDSRQTPSKTNSSCNDSTLKKAKRPEQIVLSRKDSNPSQTCHKPTSIKVEQ
ncbi:unnamed protein product [Moneuplotes crassus]|uniref:FCP1 homology domain-containing protein n=1 Tax=Euplotes crassus TaxID=5936 RepID=A0AAD2D933_EUPCR|nr:unnamed protein product [Moneuplotes crassus]